MPGSHPAPGGPGAAVGAPTLLRRLGFGTGPADARLVWRITLTLLLLYTLSFAAFYPRVIINSDEAQYVRQALMILKGASTLSQIDPLSGNAVETLPSTYAPGTALLMAPFAWLVGWRGSFLVPWLCLLVGVLVTARWLRDENRSPFFALLILGFPPTLVMGRVAMSDVPSMAIVALGLWLFWRGLDRGWPWWLASGFVAGASLAFRSTNALPFVPFYAGCLLRREGASWALVAGGLAGVGMRLVTMRLYFGDFFYERSAYQFAPETLMERLPLYALGLLVLVPGGLILALAYRGRRRYELLASVSLFVGLFLFQKFSSIETGLPKRVILALRYFIPLLPLMAFAIAESAPRLWRRWIAARSDGARLETAAARLLVAWIACIAVASLAVHPAFAHWSATQAEIREEIGRHVADDAVLVTNWPATRKFVPMLERRFAPVDRSVLSPEQPAQLLERHGGYVIVLLDRSDSEFWRRDAEQNAAFIESLGGAPLPLLDRRVTSTDRLRIWRVGRTAADPPR